jgi:membrane protease subunit (stomatin/prohibitin family)
MPDYIKYSKQPDTTAPSIATHDREQVTPELSALEYETQLEGVKRQHRGVKLAIAEAELAKDRHNLRAKLIEVGTAAIGVEIARHTFQTQAYKLIEARATSAIAQDNAASKVKEWAFNQDGIRNKLEAMALGLKQSHAELETKTNAFSFKGLSGFATAPTKAVAPAVADSSTSRARKKAS